MSTELPCTEEKPDALRLCGYEPGALGRIIEIHATYYWENWGFDVSFETQVGREISEFMGRFQPDVDGFWVAEVDGNFAGAIAIDGSYQGEDGVRLRWFIVDPVYHGRGVGGALIRQAIDFCRTAGHRAVHLWTFAGLDQARHLYEREGFVLTEEHQVAQWGSHISEQKFVLSLQP